MLTEALLATAPTPVSLSAGGYMFRMVPVRGGLFMMGDWSISGDAVPEHLVKLADFWIGQFPMTQALWRAVVEAVPGELDPHPSFFKGENRPVEQVSWDDAQVFIKKLNQLLPGWNFRLPTEAEWEYAARGGNTVARSDGMTAIHPITMRYAGSDRQYTVGWMGENSHKETKPVGLKMSNALGLFDMSGNVYEWCEDGYDDKFYEKCLRQGQVENPLSKEFHDAFYLYDSGREIDPVYVCRGGCFNYQKVGKGYRYKASPYVRAESIGFRLAAAPASQWQS